MHFDFTLTLSGVGTILSILISGWGIARGLRNLSNNISQTLWEHKVMWGDYKKRIPIIPTYPDLPA